ncbi:hypothetical protein ACVIWV_004547 [Bradyrhizobium diazoefficiens]
MMQADVPMMYARRSLTSVVAPEPSRPPIAPMPPAWASIRDAPTGVPGDRPSSAAAVRVRPAPSRVPGATISVPMRAYFSLTKSDSPMRLKNCALQPPPSWAS